MNSLAIATFVLVHEDHVCVLFSFSPPFVFLEAVKFVEFVLLDGHDSCQIIAI